MLPLLLLAVVLGSGDDKVPVKGATTVSSSYCGGVAPAAPEQLAELSAAKVDPAVRVRLYKGKKAQGELLEVKSDDKGRFALSLQPGVWCVVDGRRLILPGTKPTPGADEKCWAAASVGCDSIWTIDAAGQPPELQLHFQRGCSWNPPCGPRGAPPR